MKKALYGGISGQGIKKDATINKKGWYIKYMKFQCVSYFFYIYWRTFPFYNKITEKQMNSLNEDDDEFKGQVQLYL